jgi:hypothetical protein
MSWTNVFPVLTEEMVGDYNQNATAAEKAELDDWLGVQRKVNMHRTPHLVAVSVFWKNLRQEEPDLPPLTRELLMNAAAHGLVKRYDPWSHYIQPVLEGAKTLRASHPQVAVRVYLAADLEFLVEDFTEADCEVWLMKSNSLRHNPGAMWRFLAFAEKNRVVTVTDSDRFAQVATDIARTEQIVKTGHEFWRVPVTVDDREDRLQYRPIMATQCGSAKQLPEMRELMEALIWHTRRGSIRKTAEGGGCGPRGIVGTEWPDYGFDEWVLQTALYPRLAGRPILTLVEAGARSRYLPLDVEYVTWGNGESELVYFGSNDGCCGTIGEPIYPVKNSNMRVLLTGIWKVETENDVALITELHAHARRQDVPVEVKPVLHVLSARALKRLPTEVRQAAVLWENLAYNTEVQSKLLQALTAGHDADWVWQSDSDERADFVCCGGLKKVLRKADREGVDYVDGEWIDRIAEGDVLPAIKTSDGIAMQFPRAVLATKFWQRSSSRKVALHRRDCPTGVGNHQPISPSTMGSPWKVPVWHFKWHSDCRDNQERKVQADQNAPWIHEFESSAQKIVMTDEGPLIQWGELPRSAWLESKAHHHKGHYPLPDKKKVKAPKSRGI